MTVGLLLTSLGLGLRHGIDWDHIAAIADLSSSAESRRRGFVLSFLYAAGHAVVVMFLGVVAIGFGASLPSGVDVWMGRVVGVTLIALGGWVLIELARKGRDFRLRSRWILVLGGTFAGLRRVRDATARRWLSIEHDHEHHHDPDPAIEHGDAPAHDHAHIDLTEAAARSTAAVGGGGLAPGESSSRRRRSRLHGHRHPHRHETALADTAGGTGNGTAAGIGLLHGVGFESPTQIAVFVASTSVAGASTGVLLLGAWVVGLLIANSALAALAAYGLLGAERNFVIYATVAVLVGLASVGVGVLALLGAEALPALS